MKTNPIIVGLTALLVAGCITFPQSLNRLNGLKQGMTPAQVHKVMGTGPIRHYSKDGCDYDVYWLSQHPSTYNFSYTAHFYLKYKDGKYDSSGEIGSEPRQ